MAQVCRSLDNENHSRALSYFHVAKEHKHQPLRIGHDHQEVADGFATNCCVVLLVIISVALCVLTFPFSLIFVIRVSIGTGGCPAKVIRTATCGFCIRKSNYSYSICVCWHVTRTLAW